MRLCYVPTHRPVFAIKSPTGSSEDPLSEVKEMGHHAKEKLAEGAHGVRQFE